MDIIGRSYMLITSGNSRVKQATKENFKSHKIKNLKNYRDKCDTILLQQFYFKFLKLLNF